MGIVQRVSAIAGFWIIWGSAAAVDAPADPVTVRLDIPSQSLGAALNEFARQSGLQILVTSQDSGGLVAPRVTGVYTPAAALNQLLAHSGLYYEYLNEHTIAVRKQSAPPLSSQEERLQSEDLAGQAAGADESTWSRFRLAQATPGAPTEVTSADRGNGAPGGLAEVVVTAEKREERLLDVPVPVTVVKGDDLAQDNLTRIQDYFASVPGLSVFGGGASASSGQNLEIRGLSSSGSPGFQTPTVGFVIDDSIYGSSQLHNHFGEPAGAPDIDPSDIERVEVLKGPQGTLYGADSIGGVVKIVTKDPSTDGYSAHVQVVGEGIPDGGLGYAVRASANIPLSNEFAVRVSAFDRRDPGYIDNVQSGRTNVNWAEVYGTHIAALWRPASNFSVKLTALVQNDDTNALSTINASSDMQPTLGDLKQTGLPGTGQSLYQTQAFNGTIKAEFAGVNIVSATGYNVQRNTNNTDLSNLAMGFGYFAALPPAPSPPPNGFGVTGSIINSHWTSEKLSEEIRLSSSFGPWVDWLVGGFYTHENNFGSTDINANNGVTGAYVGSLYDEVAGLYGDPPTTLSEEAVFGDLTIHVTNKFDVQVGGRESWYRQADNHANFGLDTNQLDVAPAPGVPVFDPTLSSRDHAFTYLVTPAYRFSPALMVYARFATGYLIGGGNGINSVLAALGAPSAYGPSTTKNYEIGSKGSLDGGRLIFDASAYYIDWSAIQVPSTTGYPAFFGFYTNGGRAKSEGVELSLQAHPIQGLRLSAVGSYNDAVLTSNFPPTAQVYGPDGAPLPYSMRWSGSLSADMDVAHLGEATGFVGATMSYIGLRYGDFASPGLPPFPSRLIFPAYTTVNMHAGVRADKLAVNLFINNLGNRRGIISGDNYYAAAGGYYAQIITPRMIGLSVSRDF